MGSCKRGRPNEEEAIKIRSCPSLDVLLQNSSTSIVLLGLQLPTRITSDCKINSLVSKLSTPKNENLERLWDSKCKNTRKPFKNANCNKSKRRHHFIPVALVLPRCRTMPNTLHGKRTLDTKMEKQKRSDNVRWKRFFPPIFLIHRIIFDPH